MDFMANTDDGQLIVMLDYFPLVHYLPIKAYDRILQPMLEIHSIICKLLRERKESFDPSEPVEDFMSALLLAKHDLEVKCESDEERSAILPEDHFATTTEDIFLADYETTSTALRFIVAFVASHPKYQEDISSYNNVLSDPTPTLLFSVYPCHIPCHPSLNFSSLFSVIYFVLFFPKVTEEKFFYDINNQKKITYHQTPAVSFLVI